MSKTIKLDPRTFEEHDEKYGSHHDAKQAAKLRTKERRAERKRNQEEVLNLLKECDEQLDS